jgi:hypothetical protein
MTSRLNNWFTFISTCALALSVNACGSDDEADGEGAITFTTWGEEYIEQEIPADSGDGDGFVDGWSVVFDKFLVNFQNIVVADAAGEVAAEHAGSMLFDNTVEGVKTIIEFEGVKAKAWNRVSYEIAPASADSELSAEVGAADKQLMVDGGYSLYVAGTATKGSASKSFAWGFDIGTKYQECHSEQNGREEEGLVVKNGGQLEAQLTTHGDHFFYDRLQSSDNPAIVTSLRFDGIAAADADEDDEVTREELDEQLLDVFLYDPSGFDAATMGAFVESLARTVGHFRGEGECTVSDL